MIDLKSATPDTSLPDAAFVFGADSQSSSTPAVYPLSTLVAKLGLTPGIVTGNYYHPWGIVSTLATIGVPANIIVAVPFRCPAETTWTRIGMRVVTAQAAGLIRLGIYAASGGTPGALLVDAGAIDASTTGAKELTISTTLGVGFYFLAMLSNNGAIITNACVMSDARNQGGTATDNGTDFAQYVAQTYGALPDPFGTALFGDLSGVTPHVWLRKV